MRSGTIKIFCFCGFFCFITQILHAEVLLLKDGDILTGKIASETPQSILLNSAYGAVTIKISEIKLIIRNEKSIVPQTILHEQKNIPLRLIEERPSENIYLTENNQIIRIPRKNGSKNESSKGFLNHAELRLGSAFTTIPFIGLEKFESGKEKLRITNAFFHNFSISTAYKRTVWNNFRVGGNFSGQYMSLESAERFQDFKIDKNYTYKGLFAGASLEYSFVKKNAHEFSAGMLVGVFWGIIDVSLIYPDTTDLGAPYLKQNLTGQTISPSLGTFLSYSYQLSDHLKLITTGSYRIDFYQNIYEKLNGQNISDNILSESLKDASTTKFPSPQNLGIEIGLAYLW